jgi:hypothetical protein
VRSWAIGVVGWASSACVPFVIPPGQASVGGATTGTASRTPSTHDEGSYAMRAGFHPLGLIDEHQARTFDVGAGYALERVARTDGQLFAQGPYLEVAAYPLRGRTQSWTARYGLRTSVDVLVADEGWDAAGYGAGLALAIELLTYANGPFSSGGGADVVVGVARGEGGIGAFAGVSHRRFQDDSYWLASAGLSVRVPAAAGIFCCMNLK